MRRLHGCDLPQGYLAGDFKDGAKRRMLSGCRTVLNLMTKSQIVSGVSLVIRPALWSGRGRRSPLGG